MLNNGSTRNVVNKRIEARVKNESNTILQTIDFTTIFPDDIINTINAGVQESVFCCFSTIPHHLVENLGVGADIVLASARDSGSNDTYHVSDVRVNSYGYGYSSGIEAGDTLTITDHEDYPNDDVSSMVSIVWKSNGITIAGASDNSYTVPEDKAGTNVYAQIQYTNPSGSTKTAFIDFSEVKLIVDPVQDNDGNITARPVADPCKILVYTTRETKVSNFGHLYPLQTTTDPSDVFQLTRGGPTLVTDKGGALSAAIAPHNMDRVDDLVVTMHSAIHSTQQELYGISDLQLLVGHYCKIEDEFVKIISIGIDPNNGEHYITVKRGQLGTEAVPCVRGDSCRSS